MLKRYLLPIGLLFAIIGCGKERIVDIATPEQINHKDLLMIFPSIPKEFCYADKMTEIFTHFSHELNLTDVQMFSMDNAVDCYSYGFSNCKKTTVHAENNTSALSCTQMEEKTRICLYMMGIEYKDSDGDTFEESCIMGANMK